MNSNWLLFTFFIFALERTILVIGRHRHGQSTECTKCSPGESLSKRCSRRHDSECTPCPFGTYQPHHSYKRYCYLCSKCGDGLYIAHDCTPVRDTVCDSCHTYKGPHNADYQQKCQAYQEEKTWKMTNPSVGKGTPRTSSENRRITSVSSSDGGIEIKRRSLLMFLAAGLAILVCFVLMFLLSNRWCKTDRKTFGLDDNPTSAASPLVEISVNTGNSKL